MPHGITQEQVDTTADAITAAGERVTVEKVRAKLGTGSPNTVTRMLDVWRQGLATRLQELNTLPDLPDDVGHAMTNLWGQALQHAREHMQQEIHAEREALQQSRTALDAREAEQGALLATAQAATQQAEEAARRAAVEVATLRRLVDRLEDEGKEHAEERPRLVAQNQALETACTKLRDEIRTIEEKSAKERSAREEHIRIVEDRAHAHVDRARTDLKAARAELADARKRHQQETQTLQRTITELTRSLRAAEREAAHQRGVAEALKLKLPSAGRGKSAARRVGRAGKTRLRLPEDSDAHTDHAKRRQN